MGRKPRNLTIENLKDRLLREIDNEIEPDRLNDLLSCFMKVEGILEKREKIKEQKRKQKLATPN